MRCRSSSALACMSSRCRMLVTILSTLDLHTRQVHISGGSPAYLSISHLGAADARSTPSDTLRIAMAYNEEACMLRCMLLAFQLSATWGTLPQGQQPTCRPGLSPPPARRTPAVASAAPPAPWCSHDGCCASCRILRLVRLLSSFVHRCCTIV